MDCTTRAAQCRMEHEILQHVKSALRLTLDWDVGSVGLTRKVSSVRFTMHSFFRHMERIMSLEEEDGYMVVVGEVKPNLIEKATALEHEHDEFRASIVSIGPTMERIGTKDEQRFNDLCGEINLLLKRIDRHNAKESDLLREACWIDDGGEG